MPPPPQPGLVPVDVPLRPDELVGAWRPESRRLLLSTQDPLPLRQRVAARITAVGLGVSATITGRVVSARRDGNRYRIEVAPDETRVRAVERLLEVARGEVIAYQPRVPRFLATLPAVVLGAAGPTYMTTFSVSDHGCGLAWSGPVPDVGAATAVRLGAGNRTASFRGVVRWTARSGHSATVGVRFVSGDQSAWAMMLEELKRSGAPHA